MPERRRRRWRGREGGGRGVIREPMKHYAIRKAGKDGAKYFPLLQSSRMRMRIKCFWCQFCLFPWDVQKHIGGEARDFDVLLFYMVFNPWSIEVLIPSAFFWTTTIAPAEAGDVDGCMFLFVFLSDVLLQWPVIRTWEAITVEWSQKEGQRCNHRVDKMKGYIIISPGPNRWNL